MEQDKPMNNGLPLILQGLILGLSIAAPVGPIGVLCIRRTLTDGRVAGFLSGLGAATADMLYGAVAAFGLSALTTTLVNQRFSLSIIGGGFLIYLGIKTFFAAPAEKSASSKVTGLLGMYASTLLLTLANPATILSFVAIFAGLQLNTGSTWAGPATLVIGVFLGSASWWLILSGIVGLARERFTPAWMRWVNRLSGLVIFGFGSAILVGAF